MMPDLVKIWIDLLDALEQADGVKVACAGPHGQILRGHRFGLWLNTSSRASTTTSRLRLSSENPASTPQSLWLANERG